MLGVPRGAAGSSRRSISAIERQSAAWHVNRVSSLYFRGYAFSFDPEVHVEMWLMAELTQLSRVHLGDATEWDGSSTRFAFRLYRTHIARQMRRGEIDVFHSISYCLVAQE
jgi:hypothetical protein